MRPAGRLRALLLSPDDPAGAAAAAVVRFHLRAFEREEAAARAGEVEPIHQLRVATRRLRATLRLFAPVLPAVAVRRAREDLRWLGSTIGGVRDLDVLAQAIAARGRRLERALRAALGPLAQAIRDRRAAAHGEMVQALAAPRCRTLLARLAALEGTRDSARLGDIAPDLVRPLLRAVRRAGRRLDENAPPAAFHRLRVRVKRLRYALETLRGLGRRRLPGTLRRLEALQDLLGEHQDAVIQIAWLRAHADAASAPPATLLAMGGLVQVLARRARRRRRRFARAWRRLEPGLRRRLLRKATGAAGGRRGATIVLRATGS